MFKFSFGANLWIRSGLSSTSGSTSTCLFRANQRGQTTKRGFLRKSGTQVHILTYTYSQRSISQYSFTKTPSLKSHPHALVYQDALNMTVCCPPSLLDNDRNRWILKDYYRLAVPRLLPIFCLTSVALLM